MRKLILSIIFLLIWGSKGSAQVHVAPPALYLNDERPTGSIEVLNTGRNNVEVTIDLGFGYPRVNEDGHIYLKLFDSIPSHEPSAVNWIQIYPYRFTLPPGLRQTVRFAVFAPENLPNREYWARPIISTREVSNHRSRKAVNVQAELNIVQRTIMALNYRHGKVSAKPVLDSIQIEQPADNIRVRPYIRSMGNAASLGTLVITLSNPDNGNVLYQKEREIAVYHQLSRIISIFNNKVKPGKYRITVEFNSDREGNDNGEILSFDPVKRSRIIKIPKLENEHS